MSQNALTRPINFRRAHDAPKLLLFSSGQHNGYKSKFKQNKYRFNLVVGLSDLFINGNYINPDIIFDNYLPTIYIYVGTLDTSSKTSIAIYNYCDNSIWNYFVHIEDLGNIDQVNAAKKKFDKFVGYVTLCFENFYYHINAAREYHDYSKYLIKNRLKKQGHVEIAPFLFHSEGDFRKRTKEIFDKWKNNNLDVKFKLLLVDDYAEVCRYKKQDTTKIKEILCRILAEFNQSDRCKIECVHSLEEMLLKDGQADIIALDYLFKFPEADERNIKKKDSKEKVDAFLNRFNDDKEVKQGVKNLQESDTQYGVEGLKLLKDQHTPIKFGPLDTYWVVPNTAYPAAFEQDFIIQGMKSFDNKLRIAKGASVLNSPNLFFYQLYNLIDQIIVESVGVFLKWEEYSEKMREVLRDVNDHHSALEAKRTTFTQYFLEVSQIFNNISFLYKDGKEDNLSRSLVDYINKYNRLRLRILIHYRDLLYQLAFRSYKDNEHIFLEASKLSFALNNT